MTYNETVPSFDWDPAKDEKNKAKHRLSFSEASELFADGTDFLEIHDEDHSGDEGRFIAIGPIETGIVVVVYTEREDDVIRIVSARKATRKEVELFQQHKGSNQ